MDTVKTKTKFKFSQTSILTIVTAVIFLTGYLYDQGHLETYRLTDQYFPRYFQFYLVKTFYVLMFLLKNLFERLSETPLIFTSVSSVLAISILVILILQRSEKVKMARQSILNKGDSLKKHKYFDFWFFPILVFLFGSIAPYLAIIIIAALCTPLWGGYFLGQNHGKEEMKLYKDKGCDIKISPEGYNCVFLLDKKETIIHSGMFIAKSTTDIALWDGTNSRVYLIKDFEQLVVK